MRPEGAPGAGEAPAAPLAASPAPPIDPAKTKVAHQWKHSCPLVSCRFDPSGRYVFAGAQDQSVQRWDLEKGAATAYRGHSSWVRAIAFDPRGETLVTGGYEGRIAWWQVAGDKPEIRRSLDAHRGWLRALAVSPDGRLLSSCGNDGLVKLWSMDTGKLFQTLEGHGCHVYNVAFHPGGELLASADLRGTVREWEVASGRCLRKLDAGVLYKYDGGFHADIGGVRGMAFSADGRLLACGGISEVSNAFAGVGHPMAVLLDWEKGEVRQKHVAKEKFNGAIWGVAFHPAGYLIGAAGGGGGGYLLFWKAEKAEEEFRLKLPDTARDLDLHRDGLRLATAHFDGHVRISTLSA